MSRRRYKNNDEAISGSNSDEGKEQGPTLLKRVGTWLPSMPRCSWPSIRPWIPFIPRCPSISSASLFKTIRVLFLLTFLSTIATCHAMENHTSAGEAMSDGIPPVAAAAAVAIAINVADTSSPTEPTKRKYVPNPNAKRKKGKLQRKRKKSSYDYNAATDALGMDSSAKFMQVYSAASNPNANTAGPQPRSPPKAEVKRQLRREKNSLRKAEATIDLLKDAVSSKKEDVKSHRKLVKTQQKKLDSGSKKINNLEKGVDELERCKDQQEKKIDSLKKANRDLSDQLKSEKEASRLTIMKLMDVVEGLMEESREIMQEVKAKERELDQQKIREKEQRSAALRKERQVSARQMEKVSKQEASKIEKVTSEHEATMRLQEQRQNQLREQLKSARDKVTEERMKWQQKQEKMREELDASSDRRYVETRKRLYAVRKQVIKAQSKEAEMKNYLDGLNEKNVYLADSLTSALKAKRDAKKSTAKAKKLADERLKKWHEERNARRLAHDKLVDQQKQTKTTIAVMERYKTFAESNAQREMKKEWEDVAASKRRGGSRRWPVWVVQLICKLLVNGTPPVTVRDNIETLYWTLYNKAPQELPSVSFIRDCRTKVEVIGETITSIKLARAPTWDQLWTDATTRRQIPFTALIIGMLGDDAKIDPVVVSSCIFTEDERSETQAEGIVSKINSLKDRLNRLHEVLADKYPHYDRSTLPTANDIDVSKLGQGGTITTDTCSTAQKLRRILLDTIEGTYDYDCMHHLRNVWFGNMEKKLTKLRADLDEIDPRLRVSASISAIVRAIDKEFSLSANYPKGHGELFLEWMRKHHPGELLLHIERASGSRQDICSEGSMAIFMNYPYYVEFLDTMLRRPLKKNQQPSILQQNLFVALTSSEMISLVRLLSILHISVCMPTRWLAGKTHELSMYNDWGPMSMGRVLDTLESKMQEISKNPKLILNEKFMMGMFDEYADELPPFKEYLDLIFKKKQMSVVARKSGSKVVHFARLRQQLFSPTRKTDKKTNRRVTELAETAADAILTELHDETKATFMYLSSSKSEYSWKYCSEERKKALVGNKATNDEAESTLGGTTAQIQKYGRVALTSAAAVSTMKRNALFDRSANAKDDNQPRGIFHLFDDKVRNAIVLVAMADAPATRERNNEDLKLMATARREKEELAREKNMEKATEEYIEAMFLIRMYDSDACIKDDPKNVTKLMKKLKSETAQYDALKNNINIRVKGFGWEWCHHAWSKNGSKYSVKVLADHLRYIIRQEKIRISKGKLEIPEEPKPNVPKRREMGTLGTQIDLVETLDSKYLADEGEFKSKAGSILQTREESGVTSMYSRMQPFLRPELDDLIGERIDVLTGFTDKNTGEHLQRWCQGEVIEVLENRSKPTVNIDWDPMDDVDEGDKRTTSSQVLLPSKWNKDREGAWRMDVAIDVHKDEDDEIVMAEESDSEDEASGEDAESCDDISLSE